MNGRLASVVCGRQSGWRDWRAATRRRDGRSPHRRAGVSLSEVLVSTLVMSIGVVALASLFPISVLRSIQASQLTNAANLRYNAEMYVRTVPELLTIGEPWRPATNYPQGSMVVPLKNTRLSAFPAVYLSSGGTSGSTEPAWVALPDGNNTTADNGINWQSIALKNYVVDPLGFLLVDPQPAPFSRTATSTRWHFGNINGTPFNRFVTRFPAFGLFNPADTAVNNEIRAARAVVLPDTWVLQAESVDLQNPTPTAGPTSITLIGTEAANLPTTLTPLTPYRIVLMDDSGRHGHTRDITAISSVAGGVQVTWSGALPAAGAPPTGFTPVKARVESLERRYSYLLSVRQNPGRPAKVDVVVFFRRSFGVEDERVFSCVFRRIDRGTDGNFGTTDDQPRNFAVLQYDINGQKPFFKKGGFVCDAHNLRWYRIIDVEEPLLPGIANAMPNSSYELDPVGTDPVTGNPNNRFVRLTLDQNVVENSPMNVPNGNVAADSTGTVGGAILLRGIVEVFPLRPRSPAED